MRAISNVTSRAAVFAAIDEYDLLGAERFLEKYGFGPSREYLLVHNGKIYDSKAILGVAYGKQYPAEGPLRADEFSGGRAGAAERLARLGFEIQSLSRDPQDWSAGEVEILVDEYFAMYRAQAGSHYVRKDHLQKLLGLLPRRNQSAIEQKLSNVSAILIELGLPTIRGFGQRPNVQTLLEAVITDKVNDTPDLFDGSGAPVADGEEIAPPTASLVQAVAQRRRAVKIDYAVRDEKNRALGRAGERWALERLKARLSLAGRDELAAKTIWVSNELGDGLGYDIETYDTDGTPIHVEVKTTNGSIATPFLLSSNELRCSELDPNYIVMRIFNFQTDPKFYLLKGSVSATCQLVPVEYRAVPNAT